MAIFTGTWKDVNGVPFTPEGKVLHSTEGGGQVGLGRAGLSHNPERYRLQQVQGYLQDRWFNVLTQNDRDLWEGVTIRGKRGSPIGAGMEYPGWSSFQIACYAEVWRNGWTDMLGPKYSVAAPFARGISAVDHINQTMTINVTYGSSWAVCPHTMMIWYQMKPTKVKEPTCWRDTRMINMITEWHPDGGSFEYAVPAKFRLEKGRVVRYLIRSRCGFAYAYEYSGTRPIPFSIP